MKDSFVTSDLLTMEKQALVQRWQAVKNAIPENISSVRLLAVSKTKPASMIAILAEAGQQEFGENYVQEAITKIQALAGVTASGQPLVWHYIGHIQRNKTKDLAKYFDWVQGVDRFLLAKRLNEQRPEYLPPLNVCIQINIDDETSKSGCQPGELPELVHQISQLPRLRLRGLMIIPAKNSETAFARTKILFEECRQYHTCPKDWDTLSMGMSDDIQQAVQAGSTMVRVGTAIFGSRN